MSASGQQPANGRLWHEVVVAIVGLLGVGVGVILTGLVTRETNIEDFTRQSQQAAYVAYSEAAAAYRDVKYREYLTDISTGGRDLPPGTAIIQVPGQSLEQALEQARSNYAPDRKPRPGEVEKAHTDLQQASDALKVVLPADVLNEFTTYHRTLLASDAGTEANASEPTELERLRMEFVDAFRHEVLELQPLPASSKPA